MVTIKCFNFSGLRRVSKIFSGVFGLALCITPISYGNGATSPIAQSYEVTPSQLTANLASTITLIGDTTFTCNSVYTHDTATVSGSRINLSFTITQNSSKVCIQPLIYPPPAFGPKFSLPKLAAGQYEVWVTEIPTCSYSKPPCAIAYFQKYAGVILVTEAGSIAYNLNPTTTAAAKDFSLELLSYNFNCATTFDMLSSSVLADTISLTFLDHEPATGSICPAIYKPYGPTFKMKALKAGKYFVKAYRLPACAAQGCKMAAIPTNVGNLLVTDSNTARVGWYLKQKQTLAEKPFTLQLLNQEYGNCQTSFSHQSVSLQDGKIWLNFLIEDHPERVCIADIHPNGPSFDMAALSSGNYPIQVTELLACEVNAPFCAVKRILLPPVDTLTVSKTLGISLGQFGQKVSRSSSSQAFATVVEGSVRVTLPNVNTVNTDGKWSATVFNLSGKLLESHTFSANNPVFNLVTSALPGVFWIKLKSPTGENFSLPLVRKD